MSWDIDRVGDVAVVHMRADPDERKEWSFFRDLADACDRLEEGLPDCALVLTGRAEVFHGGLDYERVLELYTRGDVDEIRGWQARLATVMLRLFSLPRPTIAALNGDALSADWHLACACDFRIAVDQGARLGNTAVRHGVPLQSVQIELMRYAIGPAATAALALSGRLYDPPEALAAGLVHALAPVPELIPRAVEWAGRLQQVPRTAYVATKHALQAPTLDHLDRLSAPLDSALAATLVAPDNREAQAGALAKLRRTPKPWRR